MYRKEDLPPGQEGRIGIGLEQEDGTVLYFDMSDCPPATITLGEVRKIPKVEYWRHRYAVSRQCYGRLRSLWKAVILTELAFIGPQWLKQWAFNRVKKDELKFLGMTELE